MAFVPSILRMRRFRCVGARFCLRMVALFVRPGLIIPNRTVGRPPMLRDAARDFNFGLGDVADAVRESVDTFAQNKIAPRADEIDRSNAFPCELWPEMGAMGLHGITVEEAF